MDIMVLSDLWGFVHRIYASEVISFHFALIWQKLSKIHRFPAILPAQCVKFVLKRQPPKGPKGAGSHVRMRGRHPDRGNPALIEPQGIESNPWSRGGRGEDPRPMLGGAWPPSADVHPNGSSVSGRKGRGFPVWMLPSIQAKSRRRSSLSRSLESIIGQLSCLRISGALRRLN